MENKLETVVKLAKEVNFPNPQNLPYVAVGNAGKVAGAAYKWAATRSAAELYALEMSAWTWK